MFARTSLVIALLVATPAWCQVSIPPGGAYANVYTPLRSAVMAIRPPAVLKPDQIICAPD